MKKKQKLLLGILGIFAIGTLFTYVNRVNISIKNPSQIKEKGAVVPQSKSFFSGFFRTSEDNLDPASQIFLEKSRISEEQKKELIRYFNQANDTIPLTTEALRFALLELILGVTEPINDALLRLEEGKLALNEIQPPLDAITFHKMSSALLEEYKKIISIPLTVPRDQFEPQELEDDFQRLDVLVGLAKHELNVLKERYRIPLFPKSVSFYEDVIGVRRAQ